MAAGRHAGPIRGRVSRVVSDPAPGDHLPLWRSVLAVVAHPDDESFGLGAVLAGFVDAGAAASVLCFTHGESSTLHGVQGDLASVRAAELADAAQMLGVEPARLVDYPDGALSEVDVNDLAAHVVDLAAEVGAEGLLVFDIDGVTGHLDHATATLAALAAADVCGLAVLGGTVPKAVAAAHNDEYREAGTGHKTGDTDSVETRDRNRQRGAVAGHKSQETQGGKRGRRLERATSEQWRGGHRHERGRRRGGAGRGRGARDAHRREQIRDDPRAVRGRAKVRGRREARQRDAIRRSYARRWSCLPRWP